MVILQNWSYAKRTKAIIMNFKLILLISLVWFCNSGITAQETSVETSNDDDNQDQVIEEITVIGQRIILSLRMQIIEAEDNAFEIFNALNDDDMYDIHCRMVAFTGTLIKRRLCLPNYYHSATRDNALEYLGFIDGSNYSVPSSSVKTVTAYRHPIFKEKVKELAKENPEMLYGLKELFELNEELKKKRNAYHGFDDK